MTSSSGGTAVSRSGCGGAARSSFTSPVGDRDMAFAEDMARFADEVRQGAEDIKTKITTFPSGAVSLDIRVGGRVFVVDYLPSYAMFGVDELDDDGGFNSGYRFGYKDF